MEGVWNPPRLFLFVSAPWLAALDLLEKSRAVQQATDERTFHIFYQMLCGMSPTEKKEFILDDPKTYKFLSNGNLPVPGVNDSQEFEDTKEAMNVMGMPEDEQAGESCDKKPLLVMWSAQCSLVYIQQS